MSQKKPPPEPLSLEDGEVAAAPASSVKQASSAISVTTAFLQIFDLLNLRKASLFRWLGTQAYQGTLKKQKKSLRFRKGTILDQKIE